jgi:putative ABC transport system permease protein
MQTIRQLFTLTFINISSWRSRPISSTVAIISFAIVVFVFASIFSVESGFRGITSATGDRQIALVMRKGAQSELMSSLTNDEVHALAGMGGVAHSDNLALVAPQILDIVNLSKKTDGGPTNVTVRGVNPVIFRIRPQVRIVSGRVFKLGVNEVIVGKRALLQYRGLSPGSAVRWASTQWKVVGTFTSNGDLHESEIWTDMHSIQNADRLNDAVSVAHVKLNTADDFAAFTAAVEHNPQLNVLVIRESDYYRQQAQHLSNFVDAVGGLISLLMGFGAIVGAINISYAAVAARARDIATIHALGFTRPVVIGSVLVEALFLAILGGVLGDLFAYGVFDGYQASTLTQFSTVMFHFSVTGTLLFAGIAYALLMGLIGALLPSLRIAQIPIAGTLRGN